MQPFVFISHSSQDRGIAARVCKALERCGLACWHASRDIRLGEVSREQGQLIIATLRPSVFDGDVLSLDIAPLASP